MAQNSKIEWTDKTWNPVTGCTKVSQGCKHCYAERIYERFNGKGSFKNVICHEDRLEQPLKWRKPAMVFVNSMSDLFHEDVPFEFITTCFSIMALSPQHTFQILTKRAERMKEFFDWLYNKGHHRSWKEKVQMSVPYPHILDYSSIDDPLKNVWIGVSVEDQKAADERIPFLKQVPGAIRFLSCEPLLSSVMLYGNVQQSYNNGPDILYRHLEGIHWVIAGGESGPGSRPMHPDWVRSLRDQCKSANIPFFFKQWGEYAPHFDNEKVKKVSVVHNGIGYEMCKVGKKNAGRLLDDVLYNEFPKQTTYANTNDR